MTVMDAIPDNGVPLKLPLSVTEAVIVCVPTESVAETDAPVGIGVPSDDVQTRLADKSPSSASATVPVKAMEVPVAKEAPSAGAVTVTIGAVFDSAAVTMTVTSTKTGVKPPEFVAVSL